MKFVASLAAFAALAAKLVDAHYTFPYITSAGTTSAAWQYTRQTDNYNTQAPVTDVTSPDIRCYENSTAAATGTTTVTAGSTISIVSDGTIYHPGYFAVYMAANPVNSESSGTAWFKIWDKVPTYVSGEGFVFDQTETAMTFTIPAAVPSGPYLIRVEHIALHVASTFGGAQFYLSCTQVNVAGGGNGTPGPTVAFPGAYTGNEPGILIDIYNGGTVTTYTPPGPPVWTGSGSSGGSSTTTTSKAGGTTASATTTKTTTTTTTTTTASGPTVTHYGQCGGQGWTGGTVCASPYTCQVSSAYYSQCL